MPVPLLAHTLGLKPVILQAALAILLSCVSLAQDSQFLFDPNGNLLLQTVGVSAPPQILGQPQNQVVAPGAAASFSVVLADTGGVSYQWRFNGTDIGGATSDALLLLNAQAPNEGQYSVVVANGSGSVTSAPAMLWLDSDGDGMADSWELAFFGNLNQTATGDFDGDGVYNLQEFLDGTDPTDNSSARYRLTILSDGGGSWTTDPPSQFGYTNGQTVTVAAIPDPANTFHAWTGDIVTRSNPVTLVMTTNLNLLAHFHTLNLVWTNPASGDWNAATNWNPPLMPIATDNAFISNAVTVTVNSPSECLGLTLGNDLGTAPTITNNSTLTVHGPSFWSVPTFKGTGRTVLEAGSALTIGWGGFSLNTHVLENAGIISWTNSFNISLSSGSVFTNRIGALFDVQGSGTFGPGRFDNAGTFRKFSSTETPTIAASLNNYGTVEIQAGTLFCGSSFLNNGTVGIQAGTLLCNAGFTNNGVVNLSPGSTNRLAGGGSATGQFNNPATALVEWTAGTFTLNPGSQLSGTGLYRINGGTVVGNTDLAIGNLDLVGIGSVLSGTGTITITNGMNWTGGSMGGSGRTIIPAGVTLNASAPSAVVLGRVLENGGTVLWTGAGDILLSGVIVTNRMEGLFDVRNAAGLGAFIGGNRVDNAGTFRKSLNAGTTTIGISVAFNNYGTVDLQSGTLLCSAGFTNNGVVNLSPGTTNRLAGGGSATGPFNNPATALIEWTAGAFTLNAGGLLNGSGLYRINGSSATLSANVDLAVQNIDLLGGTLNGPGTVTVNGGMNWTGGSMGGPGRTIIPPGVALNLPGTSAVSLGRVLENGGTILWTGTGDISLNGTIITNRASGLFDVRNAANLTFFIVGGNRIDNAGIFRKSVNSGTTTTGTSVAFNNYGTVDLQAGTLLCGGPCTNNGVVDLSVGTTNRLAGGGSATGSFNTPSTALVEWTAGTYTLDMGSQLNGPGLYRINGSSATLSDNADLVIQSFDLLNGTLNGTGTLTINGSINWPAGSMGGTGRTIIASGAALNLASSSGVTLSRLLENGGTVVWTGAGNIVLSAGVITNRAGGLFDAQNSASFSIFVGGNRIDNAGTFRKSVSIGTMTLAVGVPFTNYGTVDIQSGILAANGVYASTSNALLNSAIGGPLPGTNFGQLQVAGTVALNGALSVVLTNGYLPTTNNTFIILTAGARSGAFAGFSYPSNQVTMQLSNTPNSVIVRVTAVATPPPPPLLLTPLLAGTNVLLTWTAISNITYRLEFNPDLTASNWNAVPGDVPASSNTASKLDPLTPSNRLYRVRIIGP